MKIKKAGLISCAILAIVSLLASETLSHLGSTYWFLLWALALTHLVISVVTVVAGPQKKLAGIVVLILLFIGQWRAIEMIAMLTIWSFRGFAS